MSKVKRKTPEKYDGALSEPLSDQLSGRPDVRVWLRLLSCSTIIEKRLRRRFVELHDTTLPRFDVMAALERRPDGLTLGELSRTLLVSNGNVTALVRQLERQGFVSSRFDPDDRRSSIVALTDIGRVHFAGLAEAHHEWIREMFKDVGVEELQSLYGVLATLKSSIDSDRREGAPS